MVWDAAGKLIEPIKPAYEAYWAETAETAKWAKATKGGSPDQYGLGEDGKEYPKTTVEISSKSHPFYTGEDRTLDKAGRVERFKQRAAKKK